jgi:hypothetical protein
VIAGSRNAFARTNGEVARQHRLHGEQQDGGQPRHAHQEDQQRAGLARDVLGPCERLRQVDLERVGAPVVGNQPGAHEDRDEEHEDVLALEELAERLRVGGQDRRGQLASTSS